MSIEEARRKLGDLVDRARLQGVPTLITRHGRPAAVITSVEAAEKGEPGMSTAIRTYRTSKDYDAACERLAAHLGTLTADQVSLIFADGGTTDAAGQTWEPAAEHLVEAAAWNRWFVEEHGAAAQFSGGEWVAKEPGPDELTDAGLAIWGEDHADFGYPA